MAPRGCNNILKKAEGSASRFRPVPLGLTAYSGGSEAKPALLDANFDLRECPLEMGSAGLFCGPTRRPATILSLDAVSFASIGVSENPDCKSSANALSMRLRSRSPNVKIP